VPAFGEKLLLVSGHCDPTINLYDWYVCVRVGIVADLWQITARGAFT
jgi:3-hydroxy-D-aspartate aldolase